MSMNHAPAVVRLEPLAQERRQQEGPDDIDGQGRLNTVRRDGPSRERGPGVVDQDVQAYPVREQAIGDEAY